MELTINLGGDDPNLKRAMFADIDREAARIVSERVKVPAWEQGDWMTAQMLAYGASLSQTKTDPRVIAYFLGMCVGQRLAMEIES